MAYPILYNANETNFDHLGVTVLSDCLSCLVTKERNGLYFLEMEYPLDGKDVNLITKEMIVKVDSGYRSKKQRFIISKITDVDNKKLIYCEHISQYKTRTDLLRGNVSVEGSASNALEMWRRNLVVNSANFFVWSDISTVNSTSWNLDGIDSAREALGGKRGSILDVWGGEFEFDNLNIKLYRHMGEETSTIIAYGRNLIDLEQEQSIMDTYTSIYPFKKVQDGESESIILLPELFVDSEHVSKYASRKVLKVDFSSDESITTVEQLRSKARSYIKSNAIGIPKVNLKLKYQDLSKVYNIYDNKAIEVVDLCDTVKIFYENLDIVNESAKVVKVIWDVLLEENHEIEVGEIRRSFGESAGITTADIEDLKLQNRSLNKEINRIIAEQEALFNRYFNEKKTEIVDEVKTGIEEAKLKAEEFKATIREEIERDKEEVLGRVRETTADFNRRLEESKRELSNSAGRGVNAEVREAIESAKREANTLVSEAKSEARVIKDKVDNLKIGGRNLALRTSDEWGNTYNNFNGSTNHLIKLYKILNKDLKIGDTLYLKMYIECSDIVGNNGRNPSLLIQSLGNITGWNTGSLYEPYVNNIQNRVYELEKKFTINEDHLRNEFWTMYMRTDHIQSGSIRIKSCKVENGTVSTPWSPAPDDYMYELEKLDAGYREKFTSLEAKDRELDTFKTEINRTVSGISQGVSTINQKFDSSGELISLKQYKSQVEQKDREITTKLTALEQYKSQDGTRQTTLLSLAERKTNELLSREIGRLSDTYVAKSTLTETIRGSERKLLESIKISNFNLLKNANIPINETTDYWVGSYPLAEPIEDGEEVTLTIKVKFSDDRNKFLMPYNSGGSVNFDFSYRLSSEADSTKYHILSKTFRWRSVQPGNGATANNTKVDFWHYMAGNPKPISIAWATLVRGKVGTVEWIPSKFDSEKAITDRLATYRQEVDRSLTDLRGIATDGQSKASRLEQTVNGVSTTVTSLTGRLDNLKVGGRNYFLNTRNFSGEWYHGRAWANETTDNNFVVKSRTANWWGISQSIRSDAEEWWTYSLDVKGENTDTVMFYSVHGDNVAGVNLREKYITINGNWQRISVTFKVTTAGIIRPRIEKTNNTGKVYIKKIKLEKGTIATDWTPAPEDEPTALTLYKTERQQTDRQILDKVTTLENGTFKKSEFRQTDDKIILAAGYEISNRKLASMISLSPEGIQAITDKMTITPYNENLVLPTYRRKKVSFSNDETVSVEIPYPSEYEFFIKARIISKGSSNGFRFIPKIKYEDNTIEDAVVANNQYTSSVGNFSFSYKFTPNNGKKVKSIYFRIDRYSTIVLENLEIYQKKSASLIVDGSITANKLNVEDVVTGMVNTGVLKAVLGGFSAVEAKTARIDNALVKNMNIDDILAKKITANSAFVTALTAIKFDFTKATGDYIQSSNGSMKWDLKNNLFLFKKDTKILFEEFGNALVMENKGMMNGSPSSGGVAFNKVEGTSLTSVVVGTSSGKTLDVNDVSFTGLRVLHKNYECGLYGSRIYISDTFDSDGITAWNNKVEINQAGKYITLTSRSHYGLNAGDDSCQLKITPTGIWVIKNKQSRQLI